MSKGVARTAIEQEIPENLAKLFEEKRNTGNALENFPKYIRRQRITRLLSLYELFKLALPIKGSIVECGVNEGFGLISWLHFSSVLEPNNLTRRIYGFDTFSGFSKIGSKDKSRHASPAKGDLSARSNEELVSLLKHHDDNRFLGHVQKVKIIPGDATKTIPSFLKGNKHLVVSLLFLDFDLFHPTKVALESFVPRMPLGSVLAFDELDNPIWPGETEAALQVIGINKLKLRRFEFDPYISFAVLE